MSFCGDSWIRAIKYGLKVLGLCEDCVCQPSPSLGNAVKRKVKSVLEELRIRIYENERK